MYSLLNETNITIFVAVNNVVDRYSGTYTHQLTTRHIRLRQEERAASLYLDVTSLYYTSDVTVSFTLIVDTMEGTTALR